MTQSGEYAAVHAAADSGEKRIYFEDEYCAVLYKKAGEDSQTFFKRLFPQKQFAAAVNRLDTPVSGLLIAAFSPQIQTQFSRAFEAGAIRKAYWAICERAGAGKAAQCAADVSPKTTESAPVSAAAVCASDITPSAFAPEDTAVRTAGAGVGGTLEHWIGFSTKTQKAFIAAAPDNRSSKARLKKAVLTWMLCGSGERYDFLRIQPHTGRTHQIRVQMAAIGRPIKGDLKYGARRSEPGGGIRLHSFSVDFTHPITGIPLHIEAPPLQPDTLWSLCIKACADSSSFGQLSALHRGTAE